MSDAEKIAETPTGSAKPMRMTDVPFETAMDYIDDSDWVLEQKLDGARALVEFDATSAEPFAWRASTGAPLKFSAAVQHFEAIEEKLSELLHSTGIVRAHLDGELIVEDGTFYIFDSPMLQRAGLEGAEDVIEAHHPYAHRKDQLETIMGDLAGDTVFLVDTAWTREEKIAKWEKINAANVEGGMAKHRMATYEYGTRSKQMVKLKLVKTADVVVTAVQRTFKEDGVTLSHGKAELAVPIDTCDDPKPWVNPKGKRISYGEVCKLKGKRAEEFRLSPRDMLPVGNASLIGKDLTIEVGSVVEVAYLYFQEAMIQPRIIRKRLPEEKLPIDCNMAQFPKYSRERI